MDAWILTATEPAAGRLYLANGYLSCAAAWDGGLLMESAADPCYLRGVYNDSVGDGVDRLAVLPAWNRLRYGAPGQVREYRRTLDLRRGLLRTTILLEEARGQMLLEQEVFASRADQHQAAIRLRLTPDFDGDLTVLAALDAPPDGDVRTLALGSGEQTLWLRGTTPTYGVELAETLHFPERDWVVETSTGQTNVSHAFRAPGNRGETRTLTQLVRIATAHEDSDPLALAQPTEKCFDDLLDAHEAAWAQLWQTDIEIEGDSDVQQWVRAALFYLWSTVREGDRWSIAPMGLSSNFYFGHVFWDAEMWMYPSLLITQPEMGASCVAYREHTIEAARRRAAANGHGGAQFPWEGAYTGDEMTPVWAETRDFQLHITADVGIGQWWYYLVTRDRDWLRDHGWPVIRACAEYWASRVEWHADRGRYEVSNVVCADEYAEHVNNDAFTNAAVRVLLRIAVHCATLLGSTAPPEWEEIAAQIHIPYDDVNARHLEYDGFDGRITKQADVELLAYPLEEVTDPVAVARDLDYYATVIDPNGPAMSFSIYAIVSAQLGRGEDAYRYFKRSYEPNTRPPFQSFSETPTNDEYFFCTGIGGSLQVPLFGFTGLRLREDAFLLRPCLPPGWKALRLHCIFLLGARTDLEIEPGTITIRRHLTDRCVEWTVPWPDSDHHLRVDDHGVQLTLSNLQIR
jgi:trehalose/maltose hydrolase-like predicted phosphorylase